jgi:LmbE family N-acetylglucosaminyl deacetylase
MKLARSTAEIFIPDGLPVSKALARTTSMCIAAHHDDIEIMAPHAILDCFGRPDRWFTGVVVTDGAGSPRTDLYIRYTDKQMQEVRKVEQRKAAIVGEFGALVMLGHPSSAVKSQRRKDVREDLCKLVLAAKPDVIIGHNLADKHDTHVALAVRTIEALRSLPPKARPRKFYGGEVWRDLDWMLDGEKVKWDVSRQENIQAALLGVFDSQIGGGKRYDLAAAARRRAAATYSQSHQVDETTALSVAMDLTPLLRDDRIDPVEHVLGMVDRFRNDILKRLERFL